MKKLSAFASMQERFRGFLPVVVDIETGGFNAQKDAILEISASLVCFDASNKLVPGENLFFHIKPFEGANIEESALSFTKIDLNSQKRQAQAVEEKQALTEIFKMIRTEMKQQACTRAILVAHNANFDKSFLTAATERCKIKRDPFHPFSSIDTVSLSALAFGQTVLAKACEQAEISFDLTQAHSAKYDTIKTAELFCNIVNTWRDKVLI